MNILSGQLHTLNRQHIKVKPNIITKYAISKIHENIAEHRTLANCNGIPQIQHIENKNPKNTSLKASIRVIIVVIAAHTIVNTYSINTMINWVMNDQITFITPQIPRTQHEGAKNTSMHISVNGTAQEVPQGITPQLQNEQSGIQFIILHISKQHP